VKTIVAIANEIGSANETGTANESEKTATRGPQCEDNSHAHRNVDVSKAIGDV
jgi:hypothetical protein